MGRRRIQGFPIQLGMLSDDGCVVAVSIAASRVPCKTIATMEGDRTALWCQTKTWEHLMTRILVTARNETGVIADIARTLADKNINIETINAETFGDSGAVSLTASDHDAAVAALNEAGFAAKSDESLVVSLRDAPGVLASFAGKFKSAGVNILSLHIVDRQGGQTTLAISCDNQETANALAEAETQG